MLIPLASKVEEKFYPRATKSNSQRSTEAIDAWFIREVSYPNWLANVVLVMKVSRK